MFAASCDDIQTNTKFAQSLALDYPILSDSDKRLAKALGTLMPLGFPNRWTYYIGKDGKIVYIDKDVKPQTAGETIAQRLAELGVARRQP